MNTEIFIPHTILMDITPELAKSWLETSPGNRNLRQSHINSLADAMKLGKWITTNQGIGFDRLGKLRDGHHRLQAVVQSGATIKMMVTFGMDEAAYQVIDQGRNRTAFDVFGGSKNLAGMIGLAAFMFYGTQATKQQLAPLYRSRLRTAHDELEACASKGIRKVVSSAPVRLAACLLIVEGQEKEYIFAQYSALVLLDYDAMNSAAKAFTKQIQSHHVSVTASRQDLIAKAVSVFDPEKANVKKLAVRDSSWVTKWVKSVIGNCINEGGAA